MPNAGPGCRGTCWFNRSNGGRRTEEIRQHLLEIVRTSEEHTDSYPFFSSPPHIRATEQLVGFGDPRVVKALEDLAQRNKVEEARPDILEPIRSVVRGWTNGRVLTKRCCG